MERSKGRTLPRRADGNMENVMELELEEETSDGKSITKCKWYPTRALELI